MIVTENQAKTKWCPMARGQQNLNRQDFACVATSCMMWRVVKEGSGSGPKTVKTALIGEKADIAAKRGYKKLRTTDQFIEWEVSSAENSEGTGYCGLAGPAFGGDTSEDITESRKLRPRKQQDEDLGEIAPGVDLSLIKRMSGN